MRLSTQRVYTQVILALIFIQLGSDIGSHIPVMKIKSDKRVKSQIV